MRVHHEARSIENDAPHPRCDATGWPLSAAAAADSYNVEPYYPILRAASMQLRCGLAVRRDAEVHA
jgi:hypothetical protein